ncbi:hypothetical protein [Lelliottia sp. WAP21]|uniref:hypothetical protein n=1 Tax=Lelliottia sp. WAP21 TaxID=2877426 RepID=UPI001E3D2404|nr:hypothetical protein [Lelliottia sp. WAP21]
MAIHPGSYVNSSSRFITAKSLMHQQNPGVGITYGKQRTFPNLLSGASNTVMSLSLGKKTVVVNYDKITRFLAKNITDSNKYTLNQWYQEESTCLISSEINRTIDIVYKELQGKHFANVKKDIFEDLQKELKTELTTQGAQSSIKHVLMRNAYLMKKINSLSDKNTTLDKNRISNYVINSLTDRIFQQQFYGMDLSKLRENVADKVLTRIATRM